MPKPIVAGNWKMNGSRESINELLQKIHIELTEEIDTEVIIFPPYVYIQDAKAQLKDINWYVGAQDVSNFDQGAYTGEISASMLRDLGCHYVLVGHSERRHILGESNELVAQKFINALNHKLIPILCVGETLEQKEAGSTESVIAKQLKSVLDLPNGAIELSKGIIAYEPVWAIGTGLSAKSEDANRVHYYIKAWFAENGVEHTPIIYGGSVSPDNAKELIMQPSVDGVLVGGASLDAHKFVEIIRCIN